MAQTKYIQINAFLTWAQVFEQNRDTAAAARQKGVTHKGVLKGLEASEGKYTVFLSPATDEDFDKVKAVLTDQVYGGAERYKDSEFGVGKCFQVSRKHLDKHTFKDRDTGEDKEFDFGGQPEIIWWNDEKGKNTPFTLDDNGFIGNGTLAVVKFSVYQSESEPTTGDTVRLEKLGIIDHVEYVTDGNSGDRF